VWKARPHGLPIVGDPDGVEGEPAVTAQGAGDKEEEPSVEEIAPDDGSEKEDLEGQGKKKEPTVRRLTPRAVIQRISLGQVGITCCLDHFGADEPECFTENNVVYINQDHPLYRREMRKRDTHVMHIPRLLTQEISIIGQPENPRGAYDLQSRLLKDAFRDSEKDAKGKGPQGKPKK